MDKNGVLVLLSGGVDSVAAIQYYLEEGEKVEALHISYGQAPSEREKETVKRVGKHFKLEIKFLELGFPLKNVNGEFMIRNALFTLLAAASLTINYSRIALGVHSGMSYYDCSPIFIEDCQRLLDGYFSGTVTLEAPFLEYSKHQIYEYFLERNLPLDLTYSCESNGKNPCGECASCHDRGMLDELKAMQNKKN